MNTQINFLSTWLKAHTKSERGAAMVEYALLLALIGAPAVSALELTQDNWDAETSGKTVFLKFYAPWVSSI